MTADFPTTTCPTCGATDPTYMVNTEAPVDERSTHDYFKVER